MKMEVLAVQQQYQTQYGLFGSSKVKDWTSTLTPPPPHSSATSLLPPTPIQQQKAVRSAAAVIAISSPATALAAAAPLSAPYLQNNTTNKIKNSINKKAARSSSTADVLKTTRVAATAAATNNTSNIKNNDKQEQQQQENLINCDDIDAAAVNDLSLRLLDELRAAKSRHLECTEVSLPCDLTTRIAAEIIRVSDKEPCGIRGCTIYIEFEDEPNNSRRIATLKLDDAITVSTFEVYLTLRQDHRGWTALLPQFMKNLARGTITISPDFTITKHKLYSPQQSSYYTYHSNGSINSNSSSRRSRNGSTSIGNGVSAAISTPTS